MNEIFQSILIEIWIEILQYFVLGWALPTIEILVELLLIEKLYSVGGSMSFFIFIITLKFMIKNIIPGCVLCHFPGECIMYHNHIKTTDDYTHDILNNVHQICIRGTNEQAVEVKNLAS